MRAQVGEGLVKRGGQPYDSAAFATYEARVEEELMAVAEVVAMLVERDSYQRLRLRQLLGFVHGAGEVSP
jgi:hypothetical protein